MVKRTIHLVKSTTIPLVASCMDCAKHRRRKAAAKQPNTTRFRVLLTSAAGAGLLADMIQNLSSAQLRKAAAIKDKIDALQTELNQILGGAVVKPVTTQKKRTMSAAGKAKIAAAQRKRWAAQKAANK